MNQAAHSPKETSNIPPGSYIEMNVLVITDFNEPVTQSWGRLCVSCQSWSCDWHVQTARAPLCLLLTCKAPLSQLKRTRCLYGRSPFCLCSWAGLKVNINRSWDCIHAQWLSANNTNDTSLYTDLHYCIVNSPAAPNSRCSVVDLLQDTLTWYAILL